MRAEFLCELGKASLSAAVMILAVILLRLRFQERTPRRVFCLLWDIVLVRLLIPGTLVSPVSIRRWLPQAGARLVSEPPAAVTAAEGTLVLQEAYVSSVTRDTLFIRELSPVPGGPAAPDWGAILSALWLAAALALAGWFLWNHLRSRRVYAASLPCRDGFVLDWLAAHPLRRPVQVRVSDRIAAPLTYGTLYPVILLPREMDWDDRETLSCVLTHEHEHIRRFDALRKALLAAALCLHWPNPLVWAMYRLANRDMELHCDEAVLQSGASRERYALALLGLEERRGRWSPSGSHFSQNALEERIRAIMKKKHVSITALIAVLVVMSVTTTVFASAAPADKFEPQRNVPSTAYAETEKDNSVMMMSNGENGEKLYSVDGGKTWMSEERYQAEYGDWGDGWQVEWWTYKEYKAWLEQEKKDLQEMIGERSWTPSTGWFTWDQAKVDETVAMYEDILEKIKNGALYSKTILDKDGNEVEDAMLGSDAPLEATIISTYDESLLLEPKEPDKAALLEELKAFGIGGNANLMTYNGQLIRTFVDGVPVGDNGYSVQYVYTNKEGTVDVHTLRSVIHNPDGSYDTMGELTGVAAAGDPGFDQALIDCAAFSAHPPTASAEGNSGDAGDGKTFEEIFARYADYGLTYVPTQNGRGNVYCNGLPVGRFADLRPDGSAFTFESDGGGELTLYTRYDASGKLTGLDAKVSPADHKIKENVPETDPDPSQIIVCDKTHTYRMDDAITVPANTTIYLPARVDITENSSYAIVCIDSSKPIKVGITDLDQISLDDTTAVGRDLIRLTPGQTGKYYVTLSNQTNEDIAVNQVGVRNSEWLLQGRSLAHLEAAGVLRWGWLINQQSTALDFDCSAPVQGTLSMPFGQNGYAFHYGIDLAAARGTDITAFADGTVSETGFDPSLGNYVVLSHAGGYSTLYGHCGSIAVSEGDSVAMGEKIAETGASGRATGSLLHFELRNGETYLDPAGYLDTLI